MILVILFSLVLATAAIISVWRHSAKWAADLQQYYIRQARAHNWDSSRWEKPWIKILFRASLVFGGIVIVAMVLALLFGPI